MAKQLALAAAVIVLVVEIGFRLFPPGNLTRERLIRGGNPAVALIQPHPYLSYALTPGLSRPGLHVNAVGYRGPEIAWQPNPAVLRILCLGGSSTYGIDSSSDAATWPARLQAQLEAAMPGKRFEVINGGVPGYSSFENVIDLALHGISLHPQIVIVYQGFNDMRAATWRHVKRDNTHFRKSWRFEKPLSTAIWELSEIFCLVRWFATDFPQRQIALSRYVVAPENGEALVDTARRPDPLAIESFRRNLRNTVAIARDNGARILVAVEAYGEATIAPDIADIVDAGMSSMARALNQVTGEYAADPNVGSFDARREFPNATGLFTDGVHMTDAGSSRFAQLLSSRLIELGWMK